MIVLFAAAGLSSHQHGTAQIRENWNGGTKNVTAAIVARQIFNGTILGVLGPTGFERDSWPSAHPF